MNGLNQSDRKFRRVSSVCIYSLWKQLASYARSAHEKGIMKVWLFILLVGVWLPHWITADPASHRTYQPIIDGGILKNVTITDPTLDYIDLSNLQIRKIESNSLDALTNIKILNLSDNMFTEFPPSIFSKLINLEELLLVNNKIPNLYEVFHGLKNLKRLDLSYHPIYNLSSYDLTVLSNSTEIIIEKIFFLGSISIRFPENSSITVPDGQDTADVFLSIFVNYNVTVPENFKVKLCMTDDGTVKSLEELKPNEPLGDCVEARVDQWGRRIELTNRGIKKFERGWYKLTVDFGLLIDLSENEIREITPELLNDLPVKMVVDLSRNHINIIKKNIMENKHCIGLFLYSNPIKTIENGAFEKICLPGLMFGRNDFNNLNLIRTLPENIEFLGVSNNNISEIPSDIFQGFRKIRAISLSDNKLEKIEPGTFDNLEHLSVIELARNQISQLNPGTFKNLPNLGELNLSDNKIMKIAKDTFSGIKSSYRFELLFSYNEIDTIEVGSFSHLNLYSLDLSHNKITDRSIANGAFDTTTVPRIKLNSNLITNLNGESFSGILGCCNIRMWSNPLRSFKNFVVKDPVEDLGNCRRL